METIKYIVLLVGFFFAYNGLLLFLENFSKKSTFRKYGWSVQFTESGIDAPLLYIIGFVVFLFNICSFILSDPLGSVLHMVFSVIPAVSLFFQFWYVISVAHKRMHTFYDVHADIEKEYEARRKARESQDK